MTLSECQMLVKAVNVMCELENWLHKPPSSGWLTVKMVDKTILFVLNHSCLIKALQYRLYKVASFAECSLPNKPQWWQLCFHSSNKPFCLLIKCALAKCRYLSNVWMINLQLTQTWRKSTKSLASIFYWGKTWGKEKANIWGLLKINITELMVINGGLRLPNDSGQTYR